ncbi:MAG: acetylglutamate kinase, partial [Solirubrobacteraceae bacterium]
MRDVATLLEALPYIREFHGKTVVIKIGGAAMTDAGLTHDFAQDIVLLRYVGLHPIVVHGGGPMITRMMERLGMDVKFVDGLRVSDSDTVDVAKMVLVGKQNKDIVLSLNRHGQSAVGICGDDGQLFRVRKMPTAEDVELGFVGEIERVDVDLLNRISENYIPVIASVGADVHGQSYNINADEAASAVAEAMGAHKLMFLTDVVGWLHDANDETSLISQASAEQVRASLPTLGGGMRPKLAAAAQAVESGVSAAHII